ncbi:lipopolysaccharide biosynthesis protein [Flavobacterium microcysteis]
MLDKIKKIKERFIYADEKNKRLAYSTLFNFIIKGFSVITSLMLLPAYMGFFPDQKILGLWFTALSVLSWVLIFDLGIGNGLRNKLVECLAVDDLKRAKKYISSAYIMVGCFVFILSVVGYVMFYFINWNSVFNIPEIKIPPVHLLKVIRIVFIGIMIQFFLKLITSVMFALKKSALPALLSLISTILLLLFLAIAPKQSEIDNLSNLAYANVILANLPLLVATIFLFRRDLKYCQPDLKNYDRNFARSILKLGGVFFVIQITYLLISNTSEFLITWFTKPDFVVDYKIYYSLFSFVGTIFSLALVPIWSEVTEAYVKGEVKWMKVLYVRLYKIALVGTFGLLVLVFLMQPVVDLWLKEKTIKINYTFSIVFVISGILFMWNAILSSFANGMGKLKISITFMTIGAIVNIPLTMLFTYLTHSWIGVIIANIISLLPFCIAQTIWLYKYFKTEGKYQE